MTESITAAVAVRSNTPGAMVRQHSQDFSAVLPSHIKSDMWVRLAQGALKKGKRVPNPQEPKQQITQLELAALNNPTAFMASLMEAARLGLEPGTEQYYLTPRRVKVGDNWRDEILGIVGYQGFIELMYRAGAISSVIAECVYTKDQFVWTPGALDTQQPPRWQGPQERPLHQIDWDTEDRGELRLVYAYAVMKDSATSKVVVLNRADINRIKASSQGADTSYSPWKNHEAAMWLKSATRQLAKWVPTSAEYMREQLRAVRDVAAEKPADFAPLMRSAGEQAGVSAGLLEDELFMDGEVVDVAEA
jgi:recombination protein RecT